MLNRFKSRLSVLSLAIIASLTSVTIAGAQEPTRMVVGFPGGQLGDVLKKVFVPWERDNNIKIEWVVGASTELVSKASASKDNPEFDVIFGDELSAYAASTRGLLSRIDESIVTNYKDVVPRARSETNDSVGYGTFSAAIFYNTVEFEKRGWAPPKVWKDLLRPEFCKVTSWFHVNVSYGAIALIMLADGDPAQVESKAIPMVIAHKNCITVFETSPPKLEEKVQLGDYLLGNIAMQRAQALVDKGLPIKVFIPEDGVVAAFATAAVVKNEAKPERMKLGQRFINHLLSPDVEKTILETMYYGPSNQKVAIPKELSARGVLDAEGIKRMVNVSPKEVAEFRQQWARTLDRGMAR